MPNTYLVRTTPNPNENFVKEDFYAVIRKELAANATTSRYAEELSSGKPIDPIPLAIYATSTMPTEPKLHAVDPNEDPEVDAAIKARDAGDVKFTKEIVEKLVKEKTARYEREVEAHKEAKRAYGKEKTAHLKELNEVSTYNKTRDQALEKRATTISVIVSAVVAKVDQDRAVWDKIPGAQQARADRDPAALIDCFIKYMSKEANHSCALMRLIKKLKELNRLLEANVKNGNGELDAAANAIDRDFEDFHALYMQVCSTPEGRGRFRAASLLLTLDKDVHDTFLNQELRKFRSEELSMTIDDNAVKAAASARLTIYTHSTTSALGSNHGNDPPPPSLERPSVNQVQKKQGKKDGRAPTGSKAVQGDKYKEHKGDQFCKRCKDAGRSQKAFTSHNSDQCKLEGAKGDKKRQREEEALDGTKEAKKAIFNPPQNPNNKPPTIQSKAGKKQGKSALLASKATSQDDAMLDAPVTLSEEDYLSSRVDMTRGTFSARNDRKEVTVSKEGARANSLGSKLHSTLDFGAQASIARESSLTDVKPLDEAETVEGIGGDVVYSHQGRHTRLGVMCLVDNTVKNDLIAPCDLESEWDFVGSEPSITGKDSSGRDVVAMGAVLYRDRNGQRPDARFERAPDDSSNRGLLVFIDGEDPVSRK
jgi:hypothetical protein